MHIKARYYVSSFFYFKSIKNCILIYQGRQKSTFFDVKLYVMKNKFICVKY